MVVMVVVMMVVVGMVGVMVMWCGGSVGDGVMMMVDSWAQPPSTTPINDPHICTTFISTSLPILLIHTTYPLLQTSLISFLCLHCCVHSGMKVCWPWQKVRKLSWWLNRIGHMARKANQTPSIQTFCLLNKQVCLLTCQNLPVGTRFLEQ